MFGVTPNHCHKREAEKDSHEEDLAARQPEFGFAIKFDSEDVQRSTSNCQQWDFQFRGQEERECSRIEYDASGDYGGCWNVIAPVCEDCA